MKRHSTKQAQTVINGEPGQHPSVSDIARMTLSFEEARLSKDLDSLYDQLMIQLPILTTQQRRVDDLQREVSSAMMRRRAIQVALREVSGLERTVAEVAESQPAPTKPQRAKRR